MTTIDNLRIAGLSPASSEMNPYSSTHSPFSTQAADSARDARWSAEQRKLALLKRTGLFSDELKGAQIFRATSLDDLQQAYSLVHEVYLKSGYIHSEASGMRLRMYETSSDTATFIAKCNGRVVGVISVVGDSIDLGLPSDSAFRQELDGLRAAGVKLCEVTNQVVLDEYRKSAVTTELMRCAVAHSLKCGYRVGVATVSPSHNGFYDLLGFQQIGAERSYSQKLHDPVVALAIDWHNYRTPPVGLSPASEYVHNFLGPENPYHTRVGMWDRKARASFLNAELLEELFVVRSDFLSQCTPSELETVRLRWGHELFRAVASNLPSYQEENVASAVPFPDFQPAATAIRSRVYSSAEDVRGHGGYRPKVQALRIPARAGAARDGDREEGDNSLWFWIGAILEGRDPHHLALGN